MNWDRYGIRTQKQKVLILVQQTKDICPLMIAVYEQKAETAYDYVGFVSNH